LDVKLLPEVADSKHCIKHKDAKPKWPRHLFDLFKCLVLLLFDLLQNCRLVFVEDDRVVLML